MILVKIFKYLSGLLLYSRDLGLSFDYVFFFSKEAFLDHKIDISNSRKIWFTAMPDKKEIWLAPSTIERKVTSRYHGNLISGSKESFLSEAAIFIIERWKKNMSYRFVLECNHARESQTHIFCLFSLSYLQDHDLLISRGFATMVTRRIDSSSLLV